MRSLLCTLLAVISLPVLSRGQDFNPYKPPRKSQPPAVQGRDRIANPVDAFLLARLEKKGLTFSAPADRLTLLRRVTFDLTGLPPTVAEQEAFLADRSPDAYEKVVERLLASPRFGERSAMYWLDLVRYAESDGFKADDLRPLAHRYRDQVIRAFNADLPYDRFVRRQIAGDELEPGEPDALIATGFNRLWPDEYNAANLEQRWQEILDDTTDVMGSVFLGLTIGCARCHDHKFDPTTQKEYFQLQSFFAAMKPRDDLHAAPAEQVRRYRQQLAEWEKATRKIREEMSALVSKKKADAREYTLGRFRAEIQQAVRTPKEKRTPYQEQIAALAELQLVRAEEAVPAKLPAPQKKRYQELEKALAAIPRPVEPPLAMTVSDVGPKAPPTYLLAGGNWQRPGPQVEPRFPEFLGKASPDFTTTGNATTGRRAALARWLTSRDNPLTARVMVNRIWQRHFGSGIVPTANDFGAQGEKPSHPELLDWLAVEFVERGWSLKHIHRLLVTSQAYRQSARVDSSDPVHVRARKVDPGNQLLWHMRRRRLEGEALRDTMLAISGELNRRMFGPSARPKLPAGVSKYAWTPDARPQDRNRPSIYVLARRNMRFPLFDVFDLPDMHNSCSRRLPTTTAPQALHLLNDESIRESASAWASALLSRHSGDFPALAAEAYRQAWGRKPTTEEVRLGVSFLHRQMALTSGADPRLEAVADFCHALFNANEFLYVD